VSEQVDHFRFLRELEDAAEQRVLSRTVMESHGFTYEIVQHIDSSYFPCMTVRLFTCGKTLEVTMRDPRGAIELAGREETQAKVRQILGDLIADQLVGAVIVRAMVKPRSRVESATKGEVRNVE
jgi:hypothetical protein